MKKSIVFVSGGLAGGGQESAMVSLANALSGMGHDVSVICLYRTAVYFKPNDSVKVIWPTFERREINKLWYSIRLFSYLRREVKHSAAKNVISFGDWFNAFAILSTIGLKKNVIITNRMGPGLKLSTAHEILNRVTYRWASKLIVQTQRAKMLQGLRYGVKNLTVIPNGIDVPDLKGFNRTKTILCVGRLSKEKGQLDLLKAFAAIGNLSWQLVMLGEGPLRSVCEEFVVSNGLAKHVTFHGHQSNLIDYYQKAGLFVLPSMYEGFPNALLEAMANGCCVVASDCIAGPAELIADGVNGNLYTPGDVKALSEKMESLMNDDALRKAQGMAARQRAHDFSKQIQVNAFDQVLSH